MTRTEFLTRVRENWGEVMTPVATDYADQVDEHEDDPWTLPEPGRVGDFREYLDHCGDASTGLDNAGRVLFSVAPDRTLPNRVGTPVPVRDLWDGWVVNVRDGNGMTPGPTGDDVPADSLPVSYLLESFAGYCGDQLHDDYTQPTDTDPTGPLPTLDAVRSVLTGLTVPTRWEDATVQGGETVQSWEPTDRVKLVRTDRPDGSWSLTVHVEPRTPWDAEGVPTP